MTTSTLETSSSISAEQLVMRRLMSSKDSKYNAHTMPQFSFIDYVITHSEKVVAFIEVKVRAEPEKLIMQYGGLMLKHRKYEELCQWARLTKTSTIIAFGFEDGKGSIYVTEPLTLGKKEPLSPPLRKINRNLDCDREEVIYLNWETDLRLILPALEPKPAEGE